MELADQQAAENEGQVTGPEIPSASPASEGSSGAALPSKEAAPEKLSLREQIVKNVETIRTEEAKRIRDASTGKFVKSEDGAQPATPKTEIQSEKQEAQPGVAPKPFAPPPGFSPETKAFLATLPADHPIKKDIEKREGEVSNGFKTYSDKAKHYDAIEQVIAPVRSTFQQAGIQSDADAIKALLGWEAGFRNPATRTQFFHNLAREYGFDLSTLVPSSQSGSPSAAQDIPEPLRPVIDQFGQVQQTAQDALQRVQTWEQQQTARELTAFASSHPHFDTVRVAMGQLMQAGLAQDLESAYQKAIALNPEISAQIRADEDKKKADELAAANAEKARNAQRAAVSPVARPPMGGEGGQPSKKAGVRESILASVKQLREEQRA